MLAAAVLATAVVLGGCASGVTRGPGMQAQKVGISASNQLSSVSLSFTEDR